MKLNLKNLSNLLNAPAVEPYVIEKVNNKTGEVEKLHIDPAYTGALIFTPYPAYM